MMIPVLEAGGPIEGPPPRGLEAQKGRLPAVPAARRAPATMSRAARLRTLQWLTVLVPAVCAGLYETLRHSLLSSALPLGWGTILSVAVVLVISFLFARVSFGIIRGMDARLVARNRELQALNRQVERQAVIEERDRLAREMHDSVAQVLAYLLVRLDTIEGLVERGRSPEAAGEVRRLRDSAQEAYEDVREAITGLRARPDGGPFGVAAALQAYVGQFSERHGIAATFEAGKFSDAESLPPAAEVQIIRIAQEALANVRKHARAGRVAVSFWHDVSGWHLR